MSKHGKTYETRLTLLLTLAFGFVFFDRNALNFLTPFVAPDLHLSNTQLGMISAGFSFAWAVAGYLGGAMSDASGRRKPFLVVSFIVFSLCSCFSGLAASFVVLLASRVLMGLSEGPIMPVMQSLIMLESTESRRGLNMGLVLNFGSALLGSTAAPLVLVALASQYGWRGTFYLAAVPGLLIAALMWWYIREPKPGVSAEQMAADSAHEPKMSLLGVFKDSNVWLCTLIAIFMVPWMVLGWVFLPLFFVNLRHIPVSDMSLLMSVIGISAAVFAIVVPGLSDRVGRKPIMIAFALVGVVAPLAVSHYEGSLVILGLLIFLGWSASGVMSIFMATIPSESVPARYIASTLGIVMGAGEMIGGVLMPIGAGKAADIYGLQAPVYIQSGCALAAALLALFLRETAPAKVNPKGLSASQQTPSSTESSAFPAQAGK